MTEPPDPNAFTQPLPAVGPPPPRPGSQKPPLRGPYVHRFGSLPLYLLARLAAFAVDFVAVPFVIATFAFAAFDRGMAAFAARNAGGFETLAAVSFAIAIVFAYLCEALTGGTLGKLIFALHVRRRDGGHAGGGRVLVRYLLLPLDLLLIGPLLALATPRRQRLGDVAGGTVVSMSPIGLFAPVLGLLVVLAAGYAQITYGGGLTSALEVAAETSIVAPPLLVKAASVLGIGSSALASLHLETPQPVVGATPEPAVSAAVTPEPSPDGESSGLP